MKASPLPIYAYSKAPPSRPPDKTPRFGGIGDAASSLVGFIDSNRMMELMTSDGFGMILPRTALALKCRGSDDGRETFLREVSGLIGNIFLVGWAGYAITRMLGDSVNRYNPKGLPGRTWIAAPNLHAFGRIYQDELGKASSATEARQNFVERILGNLESDDRKMSIEARISSLEQLDSTSQAKILQKMKDSVPDATKVDLAQCKNWLKTLSSVKDHLKDPAQKTVHTELRQKMKQHFLEAGWGKLSASATKDLAKVYQLNGSDSTVLRTLPLDEQAQRRVNSQAEAFKKSHHLEQVTEADLARVLKQHGFDQKKEFIKQRLSLSLNDLRSDAKEFQKQIDKKALLHGLTSTVDLNHRLANGNETIQLSSNRGILLREMKHFLEQFADRAAYEAKTNSSANANWGEVRHKINSNLFHAAHKTDGGNHFLRRLIPHEKDGLITAAMKSKGAYTWVPMAIGFAAAGAFTFYNNYLTMKKHSGKVFFPGEGMPPIEGTAKSAAPIGGRPAAPGGMGIYHNFGTFPNYPQFRNSQGGIIA